MSDRYSYRNLILWQQAQELAHDIIQITKRMTPSWASAIIARQIISAATSIGANIAEGHGRFSVAAHRNHLSIARGSAAETDSWLDLMRREGILNEDEESQLHIRCRKLIAMLTTKINTLSDQAKGDAGSIRESAESYEAHHETETVWPYTVDDYLDSTM